MNHSVSHGFYQGRCDRIAVTRKPEYSYNAAHYISLESSSAWKLTSVAVTISSSVIGAYIQYRKEEDEKKRKSRFKTTIEIPVLSSVKVKKGRKVKIALVGIGNFARSFHLPNLKELKDLYQIYAVVDSNGALGREIANLEKVPKASTSMDDLLSDPELDAVLIATRHNTHADLTLKAIKAGKAVFVEKPMAMSREEVENIVSMLEKNPVQYMVGFNRRFSPTAVRAKEILKKRKAPVIILYRVMAGYLPPEHWTQGEEGGGRLVGEACHMFDLFNYLVGSCDVTDVQVMAVPPGDSGIIHPDNVSVNISYGDGSLCTLLYLASGGKNLVVALGIPIGIIMKRTGRY